MKKLLRVALFSGGLTLLRMASGFIIAKAVAVYTGPSGMAMLGQVQSLVAALNGIVTAPAGSGIVRYTAEHHEQGFEACAPWWKASLHWLLALLAMIIPLGCVAAAPLAGWLFGSSSYAWLVVVTTGILPLSAANTLVASVLNGQQQYRRFIILGMASVAIATVLLLVLVVQMGLKGALLGAAAFSALSGAVMLLGCLDQPWLRLRYWWGSANLQQFKGIGGYVLMAITSAVCIPTSLIVVRNILVAHVGWEKAGEWQAVYKISEVYLGVITMALGTYFLPRLATLKSYQAIRAETFAVAKVVMPIVTLMALAVYLLRDVAITLLFTEQFRASRDLFAIQLIGDVIKILSWLFAYPMLSHGMVRWFFFTEIFFSMTLVVLVFLSVPFGGVQAANIAYLVNYIVYFWVVYIGLGRKVKYACE
ncbi:O-antigen translocase [Gulbenkiania mobilis]|uniref:O-antigen translocase n=1 Tax=Gulbenkiania mobilis TaxID=397457 RepID=UPI0006BBD8BF|nr:O-antigen translocase [Gulbenkiania mobilis]